MVDDARTLKRNSLFLMQGIKDENLQQLLEYIVKIPIDHPITDTGMTAFAYACS